MPYSGGSADPSAIAAVVAQGLPFTSPPVPIRAGKDAVFGSITVPAGKRLVVRSAGVSLELGADATGVKAQAWNATDGVEICAADGVASEDFSSDNTLAAGKVALFRFVNGTGATVVASGFVNASFADA